MKEQQAAGAFSGFEPARLRSFTGEVSPAYGIFHDV